VNRMKQNDDDRSDDVSVQKATDVNHSFITSTDEFKSIDTSFSVQAFAHLTYIDVLIQGINNPLHALVDSGAEVCVAHKRLFNETE